MPQNPNLDKAAYQSTVLEVAHRLSEEPVRDPVLASLQNELWQLTHPGGVESVLGRLATDYIVAPSVETAANRKIIRTIFGHLRRSGDTASEGKPLIPEGSSMAYQLVRFQDKQIYQRDYLALVRRILSSTNGVLAGNDTFSQLSLTALDEEAVAGADSHIIAAWEEWGGETSECHQIHPRGPVAVKILQHAEADLLKANLAAQHGKGRNEDDDRGAVLVVPRPFEAASEPVPVPRSATTHPWFD